MADEKPSGATRRGNLTTARRAQQMMVRPEADDAVTAALRRLRLTKVGAVSALYLWFSKQSPAVQQLVVGVLPPQFADEAANELVTWFAENYEAFRVEAEALVVPD